MRPEISIHDPLSLGGELLLNRDPLFRGSGASSSLQKCLSNSMAGNPVARKRSHANRDLPAPPRPRTTTRFTDKRVRDSRPHDVALNTTSCLSNYARTFVPAQLTEYAHAVSLHSASDPARGSRPRSPWAARRHPVELRFANGPARSVAREPATTNCTRAPRPARKRWPRPAARGDARPWPQRSLLLCETCDSLPDSRAGGQSRRDDDLHTRFEPTNPPGYRAHGPFLARHRGDPRRTDHSHNAP